MAVSGGFLDQSARRSDIGKTMFAKNAERALANLEVPDNSAAIGPAGDIKALLISNSDDSAINQFLSAGTSLNVLTPRAGSLRALAAGIQCRADFCDLTRSQYFHPVTAAAGNCGYLFNTGKSHFCYVGELERACRILNLSHPRNDSTDTSISKGVINAHDLSGRFWKCILLKLKNDLMERGKLEIDFGRICYNALVSLLRVQSESLRMDRASDSDVLLEKPMIKH